MKLTVKTLKGEKFDVLVEETHTILQVKEIIVRSLSFCDYVNRKDAVRKLRSTWISFEENVN
jgi:hypothetical protein